MSKTLFSIEVFFFFFIVCMSTEQHLSCGSTHNFRLFLPIFFTFIPSFRSYSLRRRHLKRSVEWLIQTHWQESKRVNGITKDIYFYNFRKKIIMWYGNPIHCEFVLIPEDITNNEGSQKKDFFFADMTLLMIRRILNFYGETSYSLVHNVLYTYRIHIPHRFTPLSHNSWRFVLLTYISKKMRRR